MQTKTNGRSLPRGWQWAKLSDVCNIIMGQSPPGHTYRKTPEGLPFFQGKADFGLRHPVARVWCIEPTRIAKPGDILLSVRAPVGPTNVADIECCIGRGLAAIQAKEQADNEYILLALKYREDVLVELGSGSTFEAIRKEDLFNLEIPLPPLEEQQRIASRLNEQLAAVESARKATGEQLQAAWELQSAYLREVFESEKAKKWNIVKLGNVGEIIGGVQKTPDRAPTKFHKPYLTVRNVQQGYLDLSQVERFEVTPNEFARCRLHIGDILIVEGNGSIDQIGRSALFELEEDDWIHQNHIIRVRLPQDKFSPKFVSLFLNSHLGRLQMIEKAMTTSGLYTLSSGKVASLEIPLPSLDVQQKIVQDLDVKLVDLNNIQANLESQLAEINHLPASLLREAFAGQG